MNTAAFPDSLIRWLDAPCLGQVITCEIIPQDMSVSQNAVRLVSERWSGAHRPQPAR
jgi:hypothetical protein